MFNKISKDLNTFATPLIVNNLFSVVIATIMSSIIGNISPTAIVSAGVIDGLMYTLLGVLGVGTLSFNIYASRIRESNPNEFKDYFKSILILNGFIGLIFVIIIFVGSHLLLKNIYLFSGNQLYTGTVYAQIVSLKVFFNMLIFAMSNQIKVNKKTNEILKIGIISSIFQVAVSLFLVFNVFSEENKILGVGIAATLSMFLSVLSYIFILRKDIRALKNVKSSKKKFLFIKSIPLFGQELLEGSVMEVLLTVFLSRLGIIYASYLVCLNVINISLTPMFMYCNAIVVLVGERLGNNLKKELELIPRVSLILIICIYICSSAIIYIFRHSILSFFTNDSTVLLSAESILLFVIVVSIARPFFEVYKYCLQSFGSEKQVLIITFSVNLCVLLVMLILNYSGILNIHSALLTVASNYLTLFYLFRRLYWFNINKLELAVQVI